VTVDGGKERRCSIEGKWGKNEQSPSLTEDVKLVGPFPWAEREEMVVPSTTNRDAETKKKVVLTTGPQSRGLGQKGENRRRVIRRRKRRKGVCLQVGEKKEACLH